MNRRPNILLFIPHDLGDFLHCYGHKSVCTPHIDQLAGEGVRFTNCFAVCPECTSSRGGLMTGYHPHQNGLMGLANFGWQLNKPHLAARLTQFGYDTHLFGFQHETHDDPRTLGYTDAHSLESKGVVDVCRSITEFLQSAGSHGEAPWFGYAGFSHVHRNWSRETTFDPDDMEVPAFLPDMPVIRNELAQFYQDIWTMDRAIGTVLETLEATGNDRNTLVIFTSDHGAAFSGAKATLYDPGLRVPLIMRLPGRFSGGQAQETMLSNLDLTPTLLELIGGRVPDDMPGRSFLPVLRGGVYAPRSCVAGVMFYDVAYDPAHYIRTASHKYIRSFAVQAQEKAAAPQDVLSSFAGGRWVRLDDFDVLTSPSCQALVPPGTAQPPPVEELYDLQRDPCEHHNLAAKPSSQEILANMRRRVERMMHETDSPLLSGHVPPTEQQLEAKCTHSPGTPRFTQEVARRRERLD